MQCRSSRLMRVRPFWSVHAKCLFMPLISSPEYNLTPLLAHPKSVWTGLQPSFYSTFLVQKEALAGDIVPLQYELHGVDHWPLARHSRRSGPSSWKPLTMSQRRRQTERHTWAFARQSSRSQLPCAGFDSAGHVTTLVESWDEILLIYLMCIERLI